MTWRMLLVSALASACVSGPTPSPAGPPTHAAPTAPATPATPAAPTVTPPPSPTSTAGPVVEPWTRVAEPGDFPLNPRTWTVVSQGDGFLAIVNPEYGPDQWPATLYRSSDGEHWAAAEPVPGGARARATSLAIGPDVIVAAGHWGATAEGALSGVRLAGVRQADTCASEPPEGPGGAWWSSDGDGWTAVGRKAFGFAPVTDVVALDRGFVAVAGWNFGSGEVSAAWTSKDGKAWARAPDRAALRGGAMTDLATAGTTVVAVGAAWCPATGARAWRSADGRGWALTELSVEGSAGLVAAGPAGFLATGWSESAGRPVAWLSRDGKSWAPAVVPEAFGFLRDLVAVADGYLAVTEDGAIWWSADAAAWAELFTPPDGMVQRVAVGPTRAVAFGTGQGDDPEQAPMAVWTIPAVELP